MARKASPRCPQRDFEHATAHTLEGFSSVGLPASRRDGEGGAHVELHLSREGQEFFFGGLQPGDRTQVRHSLYVVKYDNRCQVASIPRAAPECIQDTTSMDGLGIPSRALSTTSSA